MKVNRRILAIMAAGLVVIASCGSDEKSGGSADPGATTPAGGAPLKVSFANATNAIPIFQQVGKGVERAAAVAGMTLKTYDNNLDGSTALDNARLMVQDKPDLIIEYNLVADSGNAIGKVFEDAGIPCVAINAPTPGCAYANLSNKQIGIDTAAIVAAEAKKQGWNAENTSVLLLQLASAGPEINDCVAYFYTTLAPELGMKEVARDDIDAQTTTVGDDMVQIDGGAALEPAYTATKDALQTLPSDHHLIVYGVNDDSALGALRAITEAGREDDILIAGLGATTEGLAQLRTNPAWIAQGEVFIDFWGQFGLAVGMAVKAGASAPAVTPFPQIVLTKANVSEFYDEGSPLAKALPALVADNQYLADALSVFKVPFQS